MSVSSGSIISAETFYQVCYVEMANICSFIGIIDNIGIIGILGQVWY